jgi:hypothetical protein
MKKKKGKESNLPESQELRSEIEPKLPTEPGLPYDERDVLPHPEDGLPGPEDEIQHPRDNSRNRK